MTFLTKKIGPLPGWAWLGIATVGGYLYFRHQGVTSTSGTGTTATMGGMGYGGSGSYTGGAGGYYLPPVPDPGPSPKPTTPDCSHAPPCLIRGRARRWSASLSRCVCCPGNPGCGG